MWSPGNAQYRAVSIIDQSEAIGRRETDSGIVDVEDVVEYKSLPSGLHNVTEDLV